MTSRRLRSIVLAGLAVIAAAGSMSAAHAAPVKNSANGHWYELVTVGADVDWNQANAAAGGRVFDGARGRLASITSQQENDFIRDFVLPLGIFDGEPWIGAKAQSAGAYQWVSGEPFSFTNWSADPFEEDPPTCIGIMSDGAWDASGCDEVGTASYVVEYVIVTSVPASTPAGMLVLMLLAGLVGMIALRKSATKGSLR